MISSITKKYPVNCQSVIISSSGESLSDAEYVDKFYFSNDWVSGNYSYWSKQFKRYKDYKKIKILQLGVFEGRMTVYLHEEFFPQKKCEYTCVDSFGKTENIYFAQHQLNKRYDEKTAFKRFKHNTKNYMDINLISSEANTISFIDLFDIIILDTDDKTITDDVTRYINNLTLRGTLFICYKLSAKTLGCVRKTLPKAFNLSAERNLLDFENIHIFKTVQNL